MKVTPRTLEEAQEAEARELLERRASRLREQGENTVEEAVHWIAEFPLGEERYALSLESLRAALPLKMVSPVPLSAPHVVGVLRFQGQVLAALSLASLLGGHGWRQDPAVLLVVDRGDGELCALDCEAIPRPTTLPMSAVEAARARAEGAVMEVFTQDRQLIHLIDLKRLFSATRGTGARHAR
ncbi:MULTISPECIES: chemotaxis protein CheW [unclassified Myxococcus]|uniref:chemotaxis protein CheW n=1 Tax=unclassified Myxococcus TaxID=2648731 RepID=UPI001594F539|nr:MULTISPECIES: chemotaxis protein CheW [unclassified Myxococcus]NVJ01425.1 chemotaxis protein CheW [Myxococcus sp. AM009]NVJ17808.1 chemotaxis protein CheW [Myxococcus sp. AM010]WIG92786.1 chemotaxis protein CheW [Myxococcus sp. SDU36]